MTRDGRHWYDERLGVAVEVPAVYLEPPGATATTIGTPHGRSLRVISWEDLALDRVEQWGATGDLVLWAQSVALVQHGLVDRERLLARADSVGLRRELETVEWLAAAHAAGRTVEAPQLYAAQEALRDGLAAVTEAVRASRRTRG